MLVIPFNNVSHYKNKQVDENIEDYGYLFDTAPSHKGYEPYNAGLSHFIFRPFKTERERIKESLELNNYFTEPINYPVLRHKFRERDKTKEIQQEMKFSPRSLSRISSTKDMPQQSRGMNSATPNLKVHLKSTYSMLLKVGVLKHMASATPDPDNPNRHIDLPDARKYFYISSRPVSTYKSKRRQKPTRVLSMDTNLPVALAQQVIIKAASNKGKFYKPKLSKYTEPILNAAEKLLIKSDVIQPKKIL